MATTQLDGMRVAILLGDNFEQLEMTEPRKALESGGALNADSMRMVPAVQHFVRRMEAAGKPLAVIGHAPWELVSAGLVKGRTLTSYYTLQDDIRNAGGTWLDREVVRDRNLVTSRQPSDIPSFNREMLALFAEHYKSALPSQRQRARQVGLSPSR